MAWTIILSILSSVVGGILSGLLVTRKLAHDNKRLYANQVFDDFHFMYIELFYSVLTDLKSLGYKDDEVIPTGPEKTDYPQTQGLLDRLRHWLTSEAKQTLAGYDKNELLRRVDITVRMVVCGDYGVKPFVDKYPLQASCFDGVYDADFLAKSLLDSLDSRDTTIPIEDWIADSYAKMLSMVDALSKSMVAIEYYRKAKPWTWRIFVPFM